MNWVEIVCVGPMGLFWLAVLLHEPVAALLRAVRRRLHAPHPAPDYWLIYTLERALFPDQPTTVPRERLMTDERYRPEDALRAVWVGVTAAQAIANIRQALGVGDEEPPRSTALPPDEE